MLTNSTIDALNGAVGAAAGTAKKNELGQDTFLKLMVAQMRNQDPFKASDPNQFLSQLAQFSTSTGISNMQTSIKSLSDSLLSQQSLAGASLVGHSVLAPATATNLGLSGGINGAVEAPEGTTRIDVEVRDSAGALVHRLQIAPQSGLTTFKWDGSNDLGDRVVAGRYAISATAAYGNSHQSLQMLLQGQVNSVALDPNGKGLQLNTALGDIALSDVRRVM